MSINTRQSASQPVSTAVVSYTVIAVVVGTIALGGIFLCCLSFSPAFTRRRSSKHRVARNRQRHQTTSTPAVDYHPGTGSDIDELHASFYGRRTLLTWMIGHDPPLLPVGLGLENVAMVSALEYDSSRPHIVPVRIPFPGEPAVLSSQEQAQTVAPIPVDLEAEPVRRGLRMLEHARVFSIMLDGDLGLEVCNTTATNLKDHDLTAAKDQILEREARVAGALQLEASFPTPPMTKVGLPSRTAVGVPTLRLQTPSIRSSSWSSSIHSPPFDSGADSDPDTPEIPSPQTPELIFSGIGSDDIGRVADSDFAYKVADTGPCVGSLLKDSATTMVLSSSLACIAIQPI